MSPEISKKVLKSFSFFNEQNEAFDMLTDRQTEVLKLISTGLLNKEIADKLEIGEPGLRVQINKIYKKLHGLLSDTTASSEDGKSVPENFVMLCHMQF